MSEQDQFVEAFKALADPVRMRILALLWQPGTECCSDEDRLCACDLEAKLGLMQPTISHHMKVLTRSGLVLATKQGRWVYYNVNRYAFSTMTGFVSRYAEEYQGSDQRSKQKGAGSKRAGLAATELTALVAPRREPASQRPPRRRESKTAA